MLSESHIYLPFASSTGEIPLIFCINILNLVVRPCKTICPSPVKSLRAITVFYHKTSTVLVKLKAFKHKF